MKPHILVRSLIVAGLLFSGLEVSLAATFTVTNLNDSGAGSLREAINAANSAAGDDTIIFVSGLNGTIVLGSTLPAVTSNIAISGPGARVLNVSGNNSVRVFSFTAGTSTISGVTIRNGRVAGGIGVSTSGGGILNSATLTVSECAIVGNVVLGGFGNKDGGDARGGGLYNGGTLTANRCTFAQNSATAGDGGDGSRATAGGRGGSANGAAIYNNGPMVLMDCTVAGSVARGGKGGNIGNPAGAGGDGYGAIWSNFPLTMTACTVSANSGIGGLGGSGTTSGPNGNQIGGIQNAGSTTVRNTIYAGNTNGDVRGSFTSQGYNLIGPLNGATGLRARPTRPLWQTRSLARSRITMARPIQWRSQSTAPR